MIAVTTQRSITTQCAPVRKGILRRLGDLLDLSRQRRALSALDDHLLRDIGLTRHEAQQEAQRKVWDVPSHWRD